MTAALALALPEVHATPDYEGPRFLAGPGESVAVGEYRVKFFYQLEPTGGEETDERHVQDFLSSDSWCGLAQNYRWCRLAGNARVLLGFRELTQQYYGGFAIARSSDGWSLKRLNSQSTLKFKPGEHFDLHAPLEKSDLVLHLIFGGGGSGFANDQLAFQWEAL